VRNRRTGTFVADRRSQASEAWVYRFRDARTGELQLPFVRVLEVAQDNSRGPWRDLLGAKSCVRVDRLLWIENDPPAFTSVYFALEHGRVLLDVPLEELHGSSAHRLMVEQFNLPTLRIEHRIGCRSCPMTRARRCVCQRPRSVRCGRARLLDRRAADPVPALAVAAGTSAAGDRRKPGVGADAPLAKSHCVMWHALPIAGLVLIFVLGTLRSINLGILSLAATFIVGTLLTREVSRPCMRVSQSTC
jgi:hypothetical protein